MNENDGTARRVYGIDLGTTYSCISVVNDVGLVEMIPGDNQSFVTPSVVFFNGDNEVLVGENAKAEARVSPEHAVERVKDHMGEVDSEGVPWTIKRGGKDRRADEIASMILKKLAANVTNHMNGEIVTDVVITVPAYFDAAQRTGTQAAGELAGFTVHGVIPEPTAAALAYSVDTNMDQTILVYDLGGGTFDTTVINIESGNVSVICTGGSRSLGGRQWDERVMEYLTAEWQKEHGSEINPLNDRVFNQSISEQAEGLKRALTAGQSRRVSIDYSGKRTEVEVTRETFDGLTKTLLDQTIIYTENILEIAKKKGYPNLDKILLVGGSTYMPQVSAAVEEAFGVTTQPYKPDMAVAQGAARFATDERIREIYKRTLEFLGEDVDQNDLEDAIQDQLPPGMDRKAINDAVNTRVTNVSSKNFGTVSLRKGMDNQYEINYLIMKNESVPATVEEDFGTTQDNQTGVRFRIIESDLDQPEDPEFLDTNSDEDAEWPYNLPVHAKELDQLVVPLSGDSPRGSTVKLRYELSPDGGNLLAVGTDPSTGKAEDITVKVVGALTQDQIVELRDEIEKLGVV